jgi:hypothetical protein
VSPGPLDPPEPPEPPDVPAVLAALRAVCAAPRAWGRADGGEIVYAPRLAALPRYLTLPVPRLVPRGPDGVPDFGRISEAMRVYLLNDGRCGVCGGRLDYWLYFLVRREHAAERFMALPAYHRECAEYAALLMGQLPRLPASDPQEASDDLGLYRTREYDLVDVHGMLAARAAPAKETTWLTPLDA